MAWFERMGKTTQAWLTVAGIIIGLLGAAFALGASTGEAARELRAVPAKVDALERSDSAQNGTLHYLMSVDSQRTAVWANVGQTQKDVSEIRCILRAQVEGTPPVRCLGIYP